jgi:hypothetical protein
VTVPDTVTHISRFAFVHCISLETVNMPSALYSIEQYAFYDCPLLQGVKLPENLNIIEERAFYGCDSITEVTIPEACKSVGDYAFMDCENRDSITVTGNDTIFGSRSMGYVYENGYTIKDGFFIDADSGTAVTYAQENGIQLKKDIIHGDVNSDGSFSIADAVMLQKWIISAGDITDIYAADLNKDEKVNIADLCLMKAMLSA